MKKLNLSDRESIEIGIVRHQPLSKIADILNKHKSSIAREIKLHRIFLPGNYYAGNDCKYAKGCTKRHLCGDERCPMYCYACNKDCHTFCNEYYTAKCSKHSSAPYVCNGCSERRYCQEDRYFYDTKVADKKAHEIRTEASMGVRVTDDELKAINELLYNGITKGQPLAHIFAVHEYDLVISERTAYRYIGSSILDVKNIDLRRQTRYKQRRKKAKGESSVLKQQYRNGRSYQDFQELMKSKSDYEVVEMDTVKGKKGKGKVLLTMLFRRNSVMLIFLMPDCKAESVIDRFNFLENGLGTERFKRLFGTILTDNGSEFKRVDELEMSSITKGLSRCSMYYCDPMASGQKGRLEENHEFIRYVLKKGTSFNSLTQDDFTLLMNHINSVKRPDLQSMSPYELVENEDEDFTMLMKLMGLQAIPADEINLTKSLLKL